jgi:hypothetical protein
MHPLSECTHAAGPTDQKSSETALEVLKSSQRLFSKEKEGVMDGLPDLAASWCAPPQAGAIVAQGKCT